MMNISITHDDRTVPIKKKVIMERCDLFELHPDDFEGSIYAVQSDIDPDSFELLIDYFASCQVPDVTTANFHDLSLLAEEFGIQPFRDACEDFLAQGGESDKGPENSARSSSSAPPSDRLSDVSDRPSDVSDRPADASDRAADASDRAADASDRPADASDRPADKSDHSAEVSDHPPEAPESHSDDDFGKDGKFPLISETPLKGMIAYLTKLCKGNVHAQGLVLITSSTESGDTEPAQRIFLMAQLERMWAERGGAKSAPLPPSWATLDRRPSYGPDKAADLAGQSMFCSEDEPDQWICWDFQDMRVQLTNYSVQSGFWHFPRAWKLEGSIDGSEWNVIDVQNHEKHENLFNGCRVVRSFDVTESESVSEYRFIRLTQTDLNQHDAEFLEIAACEFFGTLTGVPESTF
jgi:hypothetical protein